MLTQFKFGNFKCFKDETTLSMVASNYYKDAPDHVCETPFYSLLKSAAIYGANASGKTKLFQAFDCMTNVVLHSADNVNNNVWQNKLETFRLNTETQTANTAFEVVFLMDKIQYRYGFELNKNEICTEWLFRKSIKEINVFYRDEEGIDFNSRYINCKIATMLENAKMVRINALYLSALAIWNDPLSLSIFKWFADNNVLSTSINNYMGYTLSKLDSPMKNDILQLMRQADISLEDIIPNEVPLENVPDEIKKMVSGPIDGKFYHGVRTVHKVYDENHAEAGKVELTMENDESYGTVKLLALSAPIIDTLQHGKRLWIDEIDHGLHYDLLKAIIALFHNPKTNPYNAQLILNTHNISLLDENLFRRDQIYIISKNRYGESSLKAVSDFAGLRSSSKIGDMYREGRFGGIPYLNQFGDVLNQVETKN